MKISVDRDRCEGHGQCSVVDFDLFPLDDEGLSAVGRGRPVAAGDEQTAQLGVSSCPVGALSVE